jgi:hypothetical protein
MRAERATGRVIVSGMLFWYPLAGVTFQFLHYLLGLRRLGYAVDYVEDSARWVYDPRINDRGLDASGNVAAVAPVLEAHGFAGHWAYRGRYDGGATYGMSDAAIDRLYRDADVLINVTGAQELLDEHLRIPRRVHVQSDPFAEQVRADAGDETVLAALRGHDTHFSFGENIGQPGCAVPTAGFTWLPTRQPVVLDLWDNDVDRPGELYTTITTWHNSGNDVVVGGETYHWTKDREFLRVIDLPQRCQARFELAVLADRHAEQLLSQHGWLQRSSVEVSADPSRYRDYIRGSRAEFTVARDQYVRPVTGWFSDRSACYLAAGRPVITQDTGFGRVLPTGAGLFAFSDIEGVCAAVDAVESDPVAHCRAAREIAQEYFAAERVLGSLMERAGL